MNHRPYHQFLLLFWILALSSQTRLSWSWFFSSDKETNANEQIPRNKGVYKDVVSEFSMEALNDRKGVQLIENAKSKMLVPNTCWQAAYLNVFEGCSKTLADEELRSRLAWHLSNCFQQHTGRPPFPYCDAKSAMKNCLKNLDRDAHKVYLQYFLETNSICHQLQTDAFKHQTERLVNELKSSAEYAEVKLGKIEEQGEVLLQNAGKVHDSLASIDVRTQQVAETSRMVEDRVNTVLRYSEAVYEQSKGIAASQVELSEGQATMKENLAQGMALLKDSYENLGVEIVNLRNEAVEIEKEIGKVGDAMFSKMTTLQSKADDIGNIAGTSLDKQKQLLDGQSVALEGLHFLTKFQSQALEESRVTLQKLVEFGQKQQEELLQRQKQLHQSHDHLVENSKLMLAAQEAFESKQASMFVAIDKLFALHSAMLFESRVIIAFLVYSVAIFIIYMLTSIKHAYNVRHRLYLGLCLTFLIEVTILWYTTTDAEEQGRIIHMVRLLFGFLASIQYLYAIFTYRDYEMLNHKMLLAIMEKVNSMQRTKELLSWDTDIDSEINWSSWVDTELPEDVGLLEDPDYLLPEEVGENSSVTSSSTKRYNLRRRY
ncbi:protein GAMETE EXPRESSED 1 isoform X1 [Sesamum indicum]|uniref:Protein GAMETE EXPRESSED 1 isoform X1 n=1 Tax=Sesamum indicum TaxID=4182 RepID=A0A6I9TMB5_SESIN|nr:protein GAMETE EXPRESSED 1 isoform X1 [Sesamum indicum]XP_020550549.1 protein GAMETE EXPRESSED 1 isoform X1 [Sesamum indicum]